MSRRPDDAMDTSVERSKSVAREPAAKKRRRDASRAASAHRSSSRPPPRNEQGLDAKAQDRARLLQKKAQKKMNRMARGGEADRKTGPKLIRWMNEGKRRAGTSHRPLGRPLPCVIPPYSLFTDSRGGGGLPHFPTRAGRGRVGSARAAVARRGRVRASAVSELTERATFFFFSITNLGASHYQYQAQTFFRHRPRGQKSRDGRRYLRSMYTTI